jgi:hypothetical protein
VRPEDYLEVEIAEQRCRLYIVSGVEESTPFLTRTKKEIGVRNGMLFVLTFPFLGLLLDQTQGPGPRKGSE